MPHIKLSGVGQKADVAGFSRVQYFQTYLPFPLKHGSGDSAQAPFPTSAALVCYDTDLLHVAYARHRKCYTVLFIADLCDWNMLRCLL